MYILYLKHAHHIFPYYDGEYKFLEIELRCFNVYNGIVLLKSFQMSIIRENEKTTWTSSRQEFKNLADRLPDFCLYSKADNTRKKYSRAFNRFCKWCLTFGISILRL